MKSTRPEFPYVDPVVLDWLEDRPRPGSEDAGSPTFLELTDEEITSIDGGFLRAYSIVPWAESRPDLTEFALMAFGERSLLMRGLLVLGRHPVKGVVVPEPTELLDVVMAARRSGLALVRVRTEHSNTIAGSFHAFQPRDHTVSELIQCDGFHYFSHESHHSAFELIADQVILDDVTGNPSDTELVAKKHTSVWLRDKLGANATHTTIDFVLPNDDGSRTNQQWVVSATHGAAVVCWPEGEEQTRVSATSRPILVDQLERFLNPVLRT